MRTLRKILFQIHLWVGLIGGAVFVLLGLSGSLLVYPELMNVLAAPAPRAVAQGPVLPLEQLIDAARRTSPENDRRDAMVNFASEGRALRVQFPRGGRGPGSEQIFVDPVSGDVLEVRPPPSFSVVGFVHQMHEAMLIPGSLGRSVVGWAGIGMFFLGLSGLYLWWPKAGQWKAAFGVRRGARGVRLYRDIHGMFGVWFWVVFLFVTVTALPISFPGLMTFVSGPSGAAQRPPIFGQQQSRIKVPADAARKPLADIVAAAEKTANAEIVSLVVPVQPNLPIRASLGDGPGGLLVNPYTAALLDIAPPPVAEGLNRFTIQRLHGGEGFGPVWKFLVFLSGFLPLLFVVTGLLMWIKKRTNARQRAETVAA